jgi:hypothetical protein
MNLEEILLNELRQTARQILYDLTFSVKSEKIVARRSGVWVEGHKIADMVDQEVYRCDI